MYAFRDQNGKILALCIHFQVQSGDSGYMARESCHQGPPFRVEVPEIMHGAKMLPTLRGLSAAADRSLAERALRPAAHARLTCRAGPCHLARAHHLRFPLPTPPPAPAIRVPYRRKRAELHAQLNAGIKMGSPNRDPIKSSLVLPGACSTPCSPYGERTNLRFLPERITPSERTCAFLPGSQHPTGLRELRCRP